MVGHHWISFVAEVHNQFNAFLLRIASFCVCVGVGEADRGWGCAENLLIEIRNSLELDQLACLGSIKHFVGPLKRVGSLDISWFWSCNLDPLSDLTVGWRGCRRRIFHVRSKITLYVYSKWTKSFPDNRWLVLLSNTLWMNLKITQRCKEKLCSHE